MLMHVEEFPVSLLSLLPLSRREELLWAGGYLWQTSACWKTQSLLKDYRHGNLLGETVHMI